jgi:hypothetical protein
MLSDYLVFKNGLNPDAKRFGKGMKFISVMDILNNLYITYDVVRSSVEAREKDLEDFSVNYGDILFQRSSETLEDVGRSNVYLDERPCLFGGFVIRGKKKGDYNPVFFKYLLDSPYARKKIIVKGAGAQHFNIGQEGLSKVCLNFPEKAEQDKIAKVLSVVDERISTQIRIIEEQESLIIGYLQRISTKGKANGTWKDTFLRDVLTERKETNTSLHPVYSVSVSQGVINQIEYLGRSFAAKDTSNYHVAHKGDIIYTKSPTGSFPYGIIKQSFVNEPVAISPLYGVYTPVNYYIGNILHFFFLTPNHAQNYLHPLIQKGAKNTINITNEHFLDNKVLLPLNETETIKCAKFLNVLLEKISIEKKLLVSFQQQKKYLLSQMFI